MSSKFKLESFSKLFKLCKQHGFIHQTTLDISRSTGNYLSYGPLGVEMRRNLINLWWMDMVTHQEHVVGIENPLSIMRSDALGSLHEQSNPSYATAASSADDTETHGSGNQINTPDVTDSCNLEMLKHYIQILSSSDKQLPFGLAEVGYCSKRKPFQTENFLFQSEMQTHLSMQFFCAPSDTTRWQDSWHKARLQWWRKFSGTPSAFTSTEVRKESGKQKVEVRCTFPWGEDTVESLTNYGSKPIEELQERSKQNLKGRIGFKSVLPDVIEMSAVLEKGMMLYLLEAYQNQEVQKADVKTRREYMRLNGKLCPIKAAIVPSENSGEIRKISDVLARQFRDAGMNILHVTNVSDSAEKLNERLDKMGIPLSIHLSEFTLKSGIVAVRSRDTTLKRKMHISNTMQSIKRWIEES